MKFIHCADLHLDSRMEGLPSEKSKIRREEILRTFEKLCDYAVNEEVVAVIIAGDMFDTSKVTIKTRDRVISKIKNSPSVDFLYLSGNHDDENFLSSMEEKPENLKIFGENWTSFKYGNVVISGSILTNLNSRSIYDNLSLDKNNVNIVTLHGQIVGYNSSDKDCEVISIPRLRDRNIDYLALGHIHSFSDGNIDDRGKYAYCGCLDGRGFDELNSKGFVEIDIDDNDKLTYDFKEFSSRNIYEKEVNLNDSISFYDFCNNLLNEVQRDYDSSSLIKIVINGEHKTDYYIDTDSLSSRLNEIFFFAKVYDKTKLKVSEEDYVNDKTVRGEFVRCVWESNLDDDMKNKVIMLGLNALKGEDI